MVITVRYGITRIPTGKQSVNHLDNPAAPPHRHLDETELQELIHRIEARIRELDAGGESAYEKALVRSYELSLGNYRTRLANLNFS